jgi:TolB protein
VKLLALLILLSGLPLSAQSPAKSPFASSTLKPTGKIAFEHNMAREGAEINDIYVMNADGSKVRNLTRNPAHDLDPAWSPDARRILFESYRCPRTARRCGDTRIFVMNADGSGQRRLTDNQGDAGPAWSPDGRKIAFVRNAAIWVMRADGSRQHRITRNLGDAGPAWSPDGRKIAFSRYVDDVNSEIFVMNADGSSARRLTHNRMSESQQAWSPDGRKIAFVRNVVSKGVDHDEIWGMNADGLGQRRLTRRGNSPTWSPDGRYLAFMSGFGIHVMNADGSRQRRILPRPGQSRLSFGENWTPAWSPS